MLIDYTVDHTDNQLITGLEGKNLLSALTAFVAAAVHVPSKAFSDQGKSFCRFASVYLLQFNCGLLLLENIPKPHVVVDKDSVNKAPVILPEGENYTVLNGLVFYQFFIGKIQKFHKVNWKSRH